MVTLTTTYAFNLPLVGGDTNVWGGYLNDNFTKLDNLLDGDVAIAPNLVGWKVGGVAITPTAAQINKLATLTSSAVELNKLTGADAGLLVGDLNLLAGLAALGLTGTELGYVDGVTSAIQGQLNALSSGKQATSAFLTTLSTAAYASQAEAEAGVNDVNLMTALKTKQGAAVSISELAAGAVGSPKIVAAAMFSPIAGTVVLKDCLSGFAVAAASSSSSTDHKVVGIITALTTCTVNVITSLANSGSDGSIALAVFKNGTAVVTYTTAGNDRTVDVSLVAGDTMAIRVSATSINSGNTRTATLNKAQYRVDTRSAVIV